MLLNHEERPLIVMLTPDRQIDRRILQEADSLEAAGWSVKIIAMPLDKGTPDIDPRIVRSGAKAGAVRENLILAVYRHMRRWMPMNNGLMRFIKRLVWRYGVDQESFYLKLFSETAESYRPHVFVAHDLPMLPVAFKASRKAGAKLVYDSHELYSEQEFSLREKRRWAEIEKKYIGGCDLIITVNGSVAEELKGRYGLPQVDVILNAAYISRDIENSKLFHQKFALAPDTKILLLQGGLSAERNLETLVEAMDYVHNPQINLVIMGEGQLGKTLRKRAVQLKLTSRVHFHEAVPPKDLLAYTGSADAGIIPYRATCLNNTYCTPNKLFEYIAAGLPVLASDLPELRHIVTAHDIGRVGDMGSAKQTAALIDNFFSSDARSATWKENVRQARRVLNWDVEGQKLVNLYSGLK